MHLCTVVLHFQQCNYDYFGGKDDDFLTITLSVPLWLCNSAVSIHFSCVENSFMHIFFSFYNGDWLLRVDKTRIPSTHDLLVHSIVTSVPIRHCEGPCAVFWRKRPARKKVMLRIPILSRRASVGIAVRTDDNSKFQEFHRICALLTSRTSFDFHHHGYQQTIGPRLEPPTIFLRIRRGWR